MKIVDIIDKATKEYAQNGRSKKFISMEDKIVNSQKMMQVYWFARYVEGADIDKLQAAVLKDGTIEDCFYFAKYINDCDINAFLQKAIDEKDEFWINKFVGIATELSNGQKNEITQKLADSGIKLNAKSKSTKEKPAKEDIDSIIEKANAEFRKNGRSEKFVELERKARFSEANADVYLFAKHVPSADLKSLQKDIILRGDAFNMFLFAQEVEGTDINAMLTGIELAQYDYREIQQRDKKRLERLAKCNKELENAIAENKNSEVIEIKERIAEIEAEETYLWKVKDYKRRVQSMIPVNQSNK